MSSTTRWVICAICAVLGVIALIYAVIYLSVPIHSLPGFVPGKKVGVNGHYHKRAALTGVIGIVLLVVAFVVAMGARRASSGPEEGGVAGGGSTPAPAPPASTGTAPEGTGSESGTAGGAEGVNG